jgi:hypothetical protein
MHRTIKNGVLAVTAASALIATTFAPSAGAAMATHNSEHRRHHHRHHLVLTDAQKECLAGQGITLPVKGALKDATSTTTPAPEAWAAFRNALVKCGVIPAAQSRSASAIEAFKTCLTNQGVTLPPAHPTSDAERAALRAKFAACGVNLPDHTAERTMSTTTPTDPNTDRSSRPQWSGSDDHDSGRFGSDHGDHGDNGRDGGGRGSSGFDAGGFGGGNHGH